MNPSGREEVQITSDGFQGQHCECFCNFGFKISFILYITLTENSIWFFHMNIVLCNKNKNNIQASRLDQV